MIVINTDGAFDVVPYNDGVLVRTHHTECLRKMMTRIHGKKWVYAHLADHNKHTPKVEVENDSPYPRLEWVSRQMHSCNGL